MLTQVSAQEWGKYNIRANMITPAIVKTCFFELIWGYLGKTKAERIDYCG